MAFQERSQRRSCILGFTIFLGLLPFFVLVLLSDRLARLALKRERTRNLAPQAVNPDTLPRCSGLPQPTVDPATWRLTVSGEVAAPMTFSLADLTKMTPYRRGLPMVCAKGWSYNATWLGVSIEDLVGRVKPSEAAKWVEFIGADGYRECAALSKLLLRGAFLAHWYNNGPLPPQHGAPLRLIFPTKYGYKNVKWIREIVFQKERVKGTLDGKLKGYTAEGTLPVVTKSGTVPVRGVPGHAVPPR